MEGFVNRLKVLVKPGKGRGINICDLEKCLCIFRKSIKKKQQESVGFSRFQGSHFDVIVGLPMQLNGCKRRNQTESELQIELYKIKSACISF